MWKSELGLERAGKEAPCRGEGIVKMAGRCKNDAIRLKQTTLAQLRMLTLRWRASSNSAPFGDVVCFSLWTADMKCLWDQNFVVSRWREGKRAQNFVLS